MSTTATVGLGGRRRRLATVMSLVLAAVTALTITSLFSREDAEAHGATVFPGSRQYFCYFDAVSANGALDPYNEACQAAFDEVGATPFYNWFGNLDSNGAGKTVGYIPDGRLCDGNGKGPYNFAPFNDPGNWPRTHVTAGDTVEWRYNNWAHHPGRFDLYITKPGWDPSQPIGWDDIEKFQTISNPPSTGAVGSNDHYYYANMTLPQRSGYHMIFTHWVRSDSNENFYACSDVVFDGGNGEVTGIRPGAQLPGNDGGVVDPPTDPTTTPDEEPTGDPTGECTATASVSSWNGGATVNVTVKNNGTDPVSNWMIHWMWPANSGIAIRDSWSSTISTMGDMQMAGPAAWNGTISSNGSVTFGFNVTGNLTTMPAMDCIPG
jgi:chitin-binding protein